MRRNVHSSAGVLLVLLICGALAGWASGGSPEGATVSTQAIRLKGWANWSPAPVANPPAYGETIMFKEIEKIEEVAGEAAAPAAK